MIRGKVPSSQLTYPIHFHPKALLKMDVRFPKVGYVDFVEGISKDQFDDQDTQPPYISTVRLPETPATREPLFRSRMVKR